MATPSTFLQTLVHISKVLASKHKVRENHRLRFGKHCIGASEGRGFDQIVPDT